jgi:hypothetical protein
MSVKVPLSTRLTLGLELSFTLFLCSAAIALLHTWKTGTSNLLSYSVVLSVPAFAWVGLVVLGCVVPQLLSPGRLVFPLNLTLPAVYTALLLMIHALVMRTGNSIIAPSDRLLPAVMWGQPVFLGLSYFLGALALSATLAVARAAKRDVSDESLPEDK